MTLWSSITARGAAAREPRRRELFWHSLFSVAFWPVVCGVAALLLLLSARAGADFDRYESWSHALSSADIFRIRSVVASPLGLPLSLHSVGPGMLLSVGRAWFGWLGRLGLHTRPDFVFMGWAMVCAWWALLRLLLRLTSGNVPIAALVTALGFLGTHLGFYSGSYCSEAASFFALGLLFYFALGTEEIHLYDALLIGVAAGLSVVVRTQLAMYVALAIAIAACRVYRRSGISWRTASFAFAAALPCLVLLVESAYVNRWMTGSFLHTPYQFGDAQFQSVDWKQPEFLAVLLSPRHGLLAYHPLYLLGFACAAYLALTARHWTERALSCAALGITLLHLYLQAAWFCWWLGTGTFGMRGMATISLLLLPALAVVLDRRQRAGRVIWPLILACLLSSVWSLLLYFQTETNFNFWSELWGHQIKTLAWPFFYLPIWVAAVLGLAAWLWRGKSAAAGLPAVSGATVAVAFAAAADRWIQPALLQRLHLAPAKASLCWGLAVSLLTVGCVIAITLKPSSRPASRAAEIAVGTFALALAICASLQFERLARRTEAYLREGAELDSRFKVTSPVLWDEVVACYAEYRVIPGFAAPKRRLYAYLQRHRDEWRSVERRQLRPHRKRAEHVED